MGITSPPFQVKFRRKILRDSSLGDLILRMILSSRTLKNEF